MRTLTGSIALVALLLSVVLSAAQPAGTVPLKPGDKAPDFKLQASDGKEYQLSQFLGTKAVALCWFPRAGSEGAKIQCAALQAAMAGIPADKVQVFGCSTAPLDVTVAFGQTGKYSFPVLADPDGAVARSYGCLRPDGRSERWTFLIDAKGTLLAISKNTSAQTQGTDLIRMLGDAGLMPASAVPPPPATAVDRQVSLQVGALTRTCLVHVPAPREGAGPMPLVITLHGARGSGSGAVGMSGFDAMADRYGFVAAYADGIAADRSWNGLFGKIPGGQGILADDVDDIAFLRALIGLLHTTCNTDPARVFVCGHSAGAYMAYRTGVELSDLVAAVGIVNGSLGIKSLDGKPCGATIPAPVAPVSVIHIAGLKDGVVKFAGAQTPKNLFKSAPDCIGFFVEANQCNATGKETVDDATGVTRTLYSGGKAGTEVELVTVANCDHSWPTVAQGLSASQELWSFFSTHPKTIAPTPGAG